MACHQEIGSRAAGKAATVLPWVSATARGGSTLYPLAIKSIKLVTPVFVKYTSWFRQSVVQYPCAKIYICK